MYTLNWMRSLLLSCCFVTSKIYSLKNPRHEPGNKTPEQTIILRTSIHMSTVSALEMNRSRIHCNNSDITAESPGDWYRWPWRRWHVTCHVACCIVPWSIVSVHYWVNRDVIMSSSLCSSLIMTNGPRPPHWRRLRFSDGSIHYRQYRYPK